MLTITNENKIGRAAGGLTGIDKIVDDAGALNAWSSENLNISGSSTTAIDYLGEHDLVNPGAANQPTFNATDANFNNKPSLTFDGSTDYLHKAVANWRAADSAGVFVTVCKKSGTANGLFATADSGTNSFWFAVTQDTNDKSTFLKSGANHITSNTADTTSKVVAASGDGAALKLWLNAVDDTNTSAAYSWLDSQSTQRDNITIGSIQRASALFAGFDWVFSAYLPYTNDAAIISISNDLITHYSIS